MKKSLPCENNEKTNAALRRHDMNHNVLIAWQPKYELGIRIIDEQHRGIVSIINSLYYGMQNKHGEDMLAPIASIIYNYTRIHFNLEEEFLSVYGFPDIHAHRLLHTELIEELSLIEKKCIAYHGAYDFMNFLKKWWIEHICTEDMQFRKHFLTMVK